MPNRRRSLRVSTVIPLYIDTLHEVYPKNDSRIAFLIREAQSKAAKPIWEDLERFASTGNDESDLDHFRLPRLTLEQRWDNLDYASYVQMLGGENPEEKLNRSIVRRLLRKQLTEKGGTWPKHMQLRVNQILKDEKLYWRHLSDRENDEDDKKMSD
ncbi:MAG: hypothetical protein Q9157_002306 [Trypethelium eluteriae]